MVIVIIAGGSGTRLWPLSQGSHPKHLLRLTGKKSLLQNTYARSSKLTDQIYIVPEISHAEEVARQLPELSRAHIIKEPARRGTASCITLALAYLANRVKSDEPIVFLHADHHIVDDEGFSRTVRAATDAAIAERKIALIGLKPTYPATGLGYIKLGTKVADDEELPVYTVEKFVEKPELETAKQYVNSGQYLWNLGLFAAPLGVFEQNFAEFAPDLNEAYKKLRLAFNDEAKLEEVYLSLKSQPIDTALMEKTDRILVVPGRFDWADIGSFFDLHKILAGQDNNSLRGEVYQIECEDSMIHGSTKPIIAVGLDGIVVVDTPEGLVVCAKEKSQLVGELAKRLQEDSKK